MKKKKCLQHTANLQTALPGSLYACYQFKAVLHVGRDPELNRWEKTDEWMDEWMSQYCTILIFMSLFKYSSWKK